MEGGSSGAVVRVTFGLGSLGRGFRARGGQQGSRFSTCVFLRVVSCGLSSHGVSNQAEHRILLGLRSRGVSSFFFKGDRKVLHGSSAGCHYQARSRASVGIASCLLAGRGEANRGFRSLRACSARGRSDAQILTRDLTPGNAVALLAAAVRLNQGGSAEPSSLVLPTTSPRGAP